MKNKKQRFISWLSGPILFFVVFVQLGMFILYTIFFTDIGYGGSTITDIIGIIMFGLLPWGLFLRMALTYWPIIEIDDEGVKKSFLRIFFKRNIKWKDLYEIRLLRVPTGGGWIFFSTKSLLNMSIGKARIQKEVIQVAYSIDLHKAIRKYTDKEIVNLSDEILKRKM
jgi:hypothetical protein